MWLLGKLRPDFETIADFRRDNLAAIKQVCREFTLLCRKLKLFGGELVAIDGHASYKMCRTLRGPGHKSRRYLSLMILVFSRNFPAYKRAIVMTCYGKTGRPKNAGLGCFMPYFPRTKHLTRVK
jgi:hypothetical protein